MIEKFRIKLMSFSDWYENVFLERWGAWGLMFSTGCATILFLFVIFSIFSFLTPEHRQSKELSCQEGHFAQHAIYNAATKTTQLKDFFVCDKD